MTWQEEAPVITSDRHEQKSLRDAEDAGWHRRIAGEIREDWPSRDEVEQ